jgi:hypothetical protein
MAVNHHTIITHHPVPTVDKITKIIMLVGEMLLLPRGMLMLKPLKNSIKKVSSNGAPLLDDAAAPPQTKSSRQKKRDRERAPPRQ